MPSAGESGNETLRIARRISRANCYVNEILPRSLKSTDRETGLSKLKRQCVDAAIQSSQSDGVVRADTSPLAITVAVKRLLRSDRLGVALNAVHTSPVTWPARALRSIASVTRCRAFSPSSSSANAVRDSKTLSVGESSLRSRSSR